MLFEGKSNEEKGHLSHWEKVMFVGERDKEKK